MNITILSIIILFVWVFQYKMLYIRIYVFINVGASVLYTIFLNKSGMYEKLTIGKTNNLPTLVFAYIIKDSYNITYDIYYNILAGIKVSLKEFVHTVPSIIYKMLLVLVFSMPINILTLCWVLIYSIFQTQTDPYTLFLCEINTILAIKNQKLGKCIYSKNGLSFYINIYWWYTNSLTKILTPYNKISFMVKSNGIGGVFHRGTEYDGVWFVQTTKQFTKNSYNIKTENAETDQLTDYKDTVFTNINVYKNPIKFAMVNQQDHLYMHHMSVSTMQFFKKRGFVNIFYHDNNGKIVTKQYEYNEFIKMTNNSYICLINSILDGF